MYKKKKVQTVFHCIVVCFYLCVKKNMILLLQCYRLSRIRWYTERGAALKHKNILKSDISGLEASVQMCLMGFSFLIICINVLMCMYACALTFRTVELAVFLSPADGVQISTVQQSALPIKAACTAGRDQLKQLLLRHKASGESPPTCIDIFYKCTQYKIQIPL